MHCKCLAYVLFLSGYLQTRRKKKKKSISQQSLDKPLLDTTVNHMAHAITEHQVLIKTSPDSMSKNRHQKCLLFRVKVMIVVYM